MNHDPTFGFVWFILMLVPLILLQRLLHREIQSVFLILSRDARITMGIFSIIFLPGVFLHELSHFVMAKILRVRTGRFSLFPQSLPDGRLQLGYVETVGGYCARFVDRRRAAYRWDALCGVRGDRALRDAHYGMCCATDSSNLFWMGVRALPNVCAIFICGSILCSRSAAR
jgi:hypothetical protein